MTRDFSSGRARAVLVALAVAVSLASGACKNAGQRQPSVTAVDGPAGEPHAAPAFVLVDVDSHRVAFRVELARTPAEQERGLMYRKHLAPEAGMLFLFERPSALTFWMKNTLIPLDMIFIAPDHRIVGIVHDAEPLTLTSRRVDAPSQYVLEIGGGVAAERGLHAGQRVEFRGVGP